MRIPETPPVGETLRSIQAQPSRKRIVTVFATFALTAVCILAGATVATAPTVNIPGCAGNTPGPCARGGIYIPSASDFPVPACGGECPGFCPCPSLN